MIEKEGEPRRRALLDYVATVALSPGVRKARTLLEFRRAVVDCVIDDLSTVTLDAARGYLRGKVEQAAPVAKHVVRETVGDVVERGLKWLDRLIDGR